MKKIISGKRYETDKAMVIGTYCNGLDESDSQYVKETLYLKRTGEYFLHGVGGSKSRYGVPISYSVSKAGEVLYPLVYDEAKAWASKRLDADAYTLTFGVSATERLTRINLAITEADKAKLDRLRATTGKTYAEIIAEFLK